MKTISIDNKKTNISFSLIALCVFSIYLGLRIFAWKSTHLFEDTDSITYLITIKTFLTFNLQKIIEFDPDITPFYPFLSALVSLPGGSVEIGARLTSLLFSSGLFLAVLGIGRKIATKLEISFGLILLSFCPVLISLSFSVLTEPSYISTIYLGFWGFWIQYKNPTLCKAALLGIVFGLGFLNRIEGLLYVAIIPLLQGVYVFWKGRSNQSLKHYVVWCVIFVTCFSSMAIPQIWRVSHKMGKFAINGRQIWSIVLNTSDGKSEEEKIFGLDYSPSVNNIKYLKSHPELLKKDELKTAVIDYIRTVVINFKDLYTNRLGVLIGPLILIFFGFGIVGLYQAGHRFETFLIVAFIALNLVAPLLHNVVLRHIAIVAPMILLTAGIGIGYVIGVVKKCHVNYQFLKKLLPFIVLFCLIGAWIPQLFVTFRPPDRNSDYSPAEFKAPISVVTKIKGELGRVPNITAQRRHFTYFADGNHFYLPYTDYHGLVRYCDLNNIDLVYLKHSRVENYPFYQEFMKEGKTSHFTVIYEGVDAFGKKITLYQFRKY